MAIAASSATGNGSSNNAAASTSAVWCGGYSLITASGNTRLVPVVFDGGALTVADGDFTDDSGNTYVVVAGPVQIPNTNKYLVVGMTYNMPSAGGGNRSFFAFNGGATRSNYDSNILELTGAKTSSTPFVAAATAQASLSNAISTSALTPGAGGAVAIFLAQDTGFLTVVPGAGATLKTLDTPFTHRWLESHLYLAGGSGSYTPSASLGGGATANMAMIAIALSPAVAPAPATAPTIAPTATTLNGNAITITYNYTSSGTGLAVGGVATGSDGSTVSASGTVAGSPGTITFTGLSPGVWTTVLTIVDSNGSVNASGTSKTIRGMSGSGKMPSTYAPTALNFDSVSKAGVALEVGASVTPTVTVSLSDGDVVPLDGVVFKSSDSTVIADSSATNSKGKATLGPALKSTPLSTPVTITVTAEGFQDSFKLAVIGATEVPLNPPSNTSAPSIAGTPQVGVGLAANTGSWLGTTPITYAITWRTASTAISADATQVASGSTYTPVPADAGRYIEVRVSATNADGGPISVLSSRVGPIAASPPPPPPPAGHVNQLAVKAPGIPASLPYNGPLTILQIVDQAGVNLPSNYLCDVMISKPRFVEAPAKIAGGVLALSPRAVGTSTVTVVYKDSIYGNVTLNFDIEVVRP